MFTTAKVMFRSHKKQKETIMVSKYGSSFIGDMAGGVKKHPSGPTFNTEHPI
jgi:hypothetical protein